MAGGLPSAARASAAGTTTSSERRSGRCMSSSFEFLGEGGGGCPERGSDRQRTVGKTCGHNCAARRDPPRPPQPGPSLRRDADRRADAVGATAALPSCTLGSEAGLAVCGGRRNRHAFQSRESESQPSTSGHREPEHARKHRPEHGDRQERQPTEEHHPPLAALQRPPLADGGGDGVAHPQSSGRGPPRAAPHSPGHPLRPGAAAPRCGAAFRTAPARSSSPGPRGTSPPSVRRSGHPPAPRPARSCRAS